MEEKTALTWFEAPERRFTEIRASKTGEYDVLSAVYSEARAALDAIFPSSHVVVWKWDDAVARAKNIPSGNAIQAPERWVRDELIGIFQTGLSILKNGYLRSLADGIRAETVAQCLDQADALARAGYAAAAMVLVGGGLETHLRGLCVRLGCSWQGNGSISSYKQALDQGRNQGRQATVSSSDSSQIESWGKDRNDAAHSPGTFAKTPQEVGHIIEGVRQFLGRTQ